MNDQEKSELSALCSPRAKCRVANVVENETPLQFLERMAVLDRGETFFPSVATTLAQAYLNGWFGAPMNFERAENLLQASCDQGNAEACFLLANLMDPETKEFVLNASDRRKYIDYAAEQGYWKAAEHKEREFDMQDYYDNHRREQLNESDAKIERLTTSALNNDAVAQRELALALRTRWFYHGQVNQNGLNEAIAWLEKAAPRDALASYHLATLFDLDDHRKVELLKASAYPSAPLTPVPAALLELGRFYADPTSPEYSPKQAEKCFRDALVPDLDDEEKSAETQTLAGFLWKRPVTDGTEHLHEVFELFRRSWDLTKSGHAALCLGLMCLRGEGTSPNREKALEWFNEVNNINSLGSNAELWASLAIALSTNKMLLRGISWELLRELEWHEFEVDIHSPFTFDDVGLFSDDIKLILDDIELLIAGNPESNNHERKNYYVVTDLGHIIRLVYCLTTAALDVGRLNGKSFMDHYVLGRLYYGKRLGSPNLEKALEHFKTAQSLLKQYDDPYKGPGGDVKNIQWLKERVNEWCDRVQSETSLQRKAEFQRKLAQAEQEKREAIENMMAMFAHKFRGPVDSILFNTSYQHDERIYVDAARTMNGLLDIFSVVSTSPDKLLDSLKEDASGEGSPADVLLHSFKLVLVQLMSLRNRRRMSPHYLAYAKKQGDAPEDLRLSEWTREKSWQLLEESLQIRWEQDVGKMIITASLDMVNSWMTTHLLPISVEGFAESKTKFAQYGPKASLLTVIFTEVMVNAIKHASPAAVEPIALSWCEGDVETTFSCANPSSRESRTREASKGSGRGHKFLSLIADHLRGSFDADVFRDMSRVSMTLPSSAMTGEEK